jgi:hypothetical protein
MRVQVEKEENNRRVRNLNNEILFTFRMGMMKSRQMR